MQNNILALILIVAGLVGTFSNARGLTILMLGVIGAVMLFVSGSAAANADFGPAIGFGAFVGTAGLIWLFRRRR